MRLPVTVVQCDSSAQGYPASNLNDNTPHNQGWVSAPFPSYPQDITLAFTGAVSISTLKLLSHAHFISSRVEVSIGNVPPGTIPTYRSATFKHLGYIRFSGKEVGNSVVHDRQLQTIVLNVTGSFLKLTLHEPFLNSRNLCSQVGIADVAVEGDVHLEESTRVLKTGQQGLDFQMLLQGIDLEEDFVHAEAKLSGVDTTAGRMIRDVRRLRVDYEDREDYDEAQRLSGIEKTISELGHRALEVESEKAVAIRSEEYAAAKKLKEEGAEIAERLEELKVRAMRKGAAVPVGGWREGKARGEAAEDRREEGRKAALRAEIARLERKKEEAVAEEDFDAAKQLKDMILRLRGQLGGADPPAHRAAVPSQRLDFEAEGQRSTPRASVRTMEEPQALTRRKDSHESFGVPPSAETGEGSGRATPGWSPTQVKLGEVSPSVIARVLPASEERSAGGSSRGRQSREEVAPRDAGEAGRAEEDTGEEGGRGEDVAAGEKDEEKPGDGDGEERGRGDEGQANAGGEGEGAEEKGDGEQAAGAKGAVGEKEEGATEEGGGEAEGAGGAQAAGAQQGERGEGEEQEDKHAAQPPGKDEPEPAEGGGNGAEREAEKEEGTAAPEPESVEAAAEEESAAEGSAEAPAAEPSRTGSGEAGGRGGGKFLRKGEGKLAVKIVKDEDKEAAEQPEEGQAETS